MVGTSLGGAAEGSPQTRAGVHWLSLKEAVGTQSWESEMSLGWEEGRDGGGACAEDKSRIRENVGNS